MIGAQFGPGAEYVSRVGRGLLGLGRYRSGPVGQRYDASPVPAMHSKMDQGVRICHSEYLGDISSSAAYSVTTFPVNVGLNATFPWLASMAGSFQYYTLNGLMFFFRSTSATALNSTNTALGVVMGVAQYNVTQPAPTDKTSFINLAGASSAPPCRSQAFPIECKKRMTSVNALKVRAGAPADDVQLYDLCNFNVATYGSQATAVVGELWVSYDVTLMHPQPATLTNDNMSAHYYGTLASGTNLFGTSRTKKFDSIGLVFPTNSQFTIPAGIGGRWLVNVSMSGTSATIALPSVSFTNCDAMGIWQGTTQYFTTPVPGTASINWTYQLAITVLNPTVAATLAFGVAGTVPTSANVDLVVTELNPSLVSMTTNFGHPLVEEVDDSKDEGLIVPTPIALARTQRKF